MSEPCVAVTNGNNCRGSAVEHIAPGGVSVYWKTFSPLVRKPLDLQRGDPTTIGGARAKVRIASDSPCARGGATSVTAFVERSTGDLLVMSACVAAARDSEQVAQVLRSLRSMRQ